MSTHPFESSNFNGSQVMTTDIKEFTENMQNLTMFDHAYTGLYLPGITIKETFLTRKVDRVIINDILLLFFACSSMEFLPP